MNPILYRLLLTVAIAVLKYLRRQQGLLTKEQRDEIKAIMDQPEGERWYEKARPER